MRAVIVVHMNIEQFKRFKAEQSVLLDRKLSDAEAFIELFVVQDITGGDASDYRGTVSEIIVEVNEE